MEVLSGHTAINAKTIKLTQDCITQVCIMVSWLESELWEGMQCIERQGSEDECVVGESEALQSCFSRRVNCIASL